MRGIHYNEAMPIKVKRREIDSAMEQIGARIAHLRKERGLTQTKLAKQMRVRQTLISGYEGGMIRLGADMAVKIARILKVSTDELLGFKNDHHEDGLPDRRLLKRLVRFNTLPRRKQDALLQTIDVFLSHRTTEKSSSLIRSAIP